MEMPRYQDRHEGVLCNGCGAEDFKIRRYKCLQCSDFDLCGKCYDAGFALPPHRPTHSMQVILTPAEHEIYFGGGEGAAADQFESYACPCCPRLGFTKLDLYAHVMDDHDESTMGRVMCPVCVVGLPDEGSAQTMTEDLAGHLAADHLNAESENAPFFSDSDDESHSPVPPTHRQAGGGPIARVLAPNAAGERRIVYPYGGVGRGRRPPPSEFYGHIIRPLEQPAQAAASAQTNAQPTTRGTRHTYPGDILIRMNSQRSATSDMINEIRRLEAELATRRLGEPGNTAPHSMNESGTAYSSITSIDEPVAATVASGLEPAIHTLMQDERALMPSLFKSTMTEEQKEKRDVELANRSLFLQDLLLSTMTQLKTKKDTQEPLQPPPTVDQPTRTAASSAKKKFKARKAMRNIPKTKATNNDTAASGATAVASSKIGCDGDAESAPTTSTDSGPPKITAQIPVVLDGGGSGDGLTPNGAVADEVVDGGGGE